MSCTIVPIGIPEQMSIWSVEDIEPQEEVVVPVVASQSTLPEEAWSKRIRFLFLGWGGRGGTLDDLVILCQKSRLHSCPLKTCSETIRHYQTGSKLVSRESITLEMATGEGSQYASLEVPLESLTVGMPKVGVARAQ